ncbi:unnamed protein product [Owenia fusiformis]|uniref:Uncharacterized protein n=1 Tax=Owenia fusiformis TaxID=6347 RepID=A0A8J1Y9F1_OWEFU|nr:unnamed protein product [Owenia fusiformis]
MNQASNLVVPMVLWGPHAPTHCISAIHMTSDLQIIVTGSNDGQICVWDVLPNWQIFPRSMLFGHSASISCLTKASNNPDRHLFISSADNGEMCLWDISDGRCIEHTKHSTIHTSIEAYQFSNARDIKLVCNGYYPEIHVIDPLSLEILFSLSSRVAPDWISALCILRPIKRQDDVVVAISNSGTVKVWTLNGTESKASQPIYEDESKQIRCLNAHTLRCCAYNQRTVLIVCSKYWQIYDAGDFSLLCSESNRCGERWLGGEFIGVDRVVVWGNNGKGYMYKLPTNLLKGSILESANSENPQYHTKMGAQVTLQAPQAYSILSLQSERHLSCSPTMMYLLGTRDQHRKILVRGDSEAQLVVWEIPEVDEKSMKLVRQESFEKLPVVPPRSNVSLEEVWTSSSSTPGIIDHVSKCNDRSEQITATVYIPSQGKFVVGREDGSIVIVPATHTIILQLLDYKQPKTKDFASYRTLYGHEGRVNCLLYPHNDNSRYEAEYLISGGIDFCLILWDVNTGNRLHTFTIHGGEILQLFVPPPTCNTRVLPCICSVASDHSVALVSLKERKCIMLAARQLFPVVTVKWRPHDDFLILGCTDGTVYVWQMETGHLDRVVHGVLAEDIIAACGENQDEVIEKLANPSISIAQAFKRRNLATFQNLAKQRIQQMQSAVQNANVHPGIMQKAQSYPLLIQGVRCNTKDPDAHVMFFDIEALIVQLLSDQYNNMSPSTLEAHGFFATEKAKNQDGLDEAQRKIAGFIAKVKDKAENVGQKIQQKAESAGLKPSGSPLLTPKGTPTHGAQNGEKGKKPKGTLVISSQDITLETAQLLMSCLHAWGLDLDLDRLCANKLGLIRPKCPVSFGLLSRGGHMCLMMPSWHKHLIAKTLATINAVPQPFPHTEQETHLFTTKCHWQLSSSTTTQHLLTVISIANTLMGMTNASLVTQGKIVRRSLEPTSMLVTESTSSGTDSDNEMDNDCKSVYQAQIKQGWSLLAALHCVLLPDLVGRSEYKPPELQMLARRWQDRCLEIREAGQALLLGELRRIGPEGRKRVIDTWAPFLPSYVDPNLSILSENQATTETEEHTDDDDDQMLTTDAPIRKLTSSFESRRRQATAIVMLGVIGAEFGQEMEPSKRKSTTETPQKKSSVAEGFGITKYSHAMHTSKALTFLLLHPPSPRLPAFTPIRRAAIDLIGRGFTVWEPYLDVSAVLLGLLELCIDGDHLVPSMTFGLPLSPQADACRTARHALSLIATARPPAFIITMAKEVARHNALVQNAQSQHVQTNSVLVRAKSEILRVIELLVDKIPNDVVDLLVEVMDVSVHSMDHNQIKQKGLQEVFPQICRFSMVSYCASNRRICVGAKNGGLAFYDLKQSKCQVLVGHGGAVTALCFSPEGKYLTSYSHADGKLCVWQTASTSLFNIGSQQTKCVKTFNAPPLEAGSSINILKLARLVWIDNRTFVLLYANGSESKYKV